MKKITKNMYKITRDVDLQNKITSTFRSGIYVLADSKEEAIDRYEKLYRYGAPKIIKIEQCSNEKFEEVLTRSSYFVI